MSAKKQNSPSKRPSSLFLPMLAAGLLLAVLAIVVAAISNRSTPGTFTPLVTGAPRAEVDQTVIDHGTVKFETPVESVFRVRNIGDMPLMILGEPRVELVQGC